MAHSQFAPGLCLGAVRLSGPLASCLRVGVAACLWEIRTLGVAAPFGETRTSGVAAYLQEIRTLLLPAYFNWAFF
jgi:hypothetical protein